MKKCDMKKCRAECCKRAPLPETFVRQYANRMQRQPEIMEVSDGGQIIAADRQGYCVFLADDYRCAVYRERPELCRMFGSGSSVLACWHHSNVKRKFSRDQYGCPHCGGTNIDYRSAGPDEKCIVQCCCSDCNYATGFSEPGPLEAGMPAARKLWEERCRNMKQEK